MVLRNVAKTFSLEEQRQEINLIAQDLFNLANTPEADPIFVGSPAANITSAQISNWDVAFTWGNHAVNGYVTNISLTQNPAAGSGSLQLARIGDTYSFTYTPPLVDLSAYSKLTVGNTAPNLPMTGDLWWKSDDGVLKIYYQDADSIQWVDASPNGYGGAAGASVTTSDAAPGSPTDGDLWWDSTTGILKIFYQDGDSAQWTDATPRGAGGSGSSTPPSILHANVAAFPPVGASESLFAYADDTGSMYYSNGVSWTSQRLVTTNSVTSSDFATLLSNSQLTYTINALDYTGGTTEENAARKVIRLEDSSGTTDQLVLVAGTGLSISRTGDEIELDNDVTDTTYSISAEDAVGTADSLFVMTDSDGNTDGIKFAGADGLTVERTDANTITFRAPSSGSGGTFTSEDAQDAAAQLFTNGTHSGITFTYNDSNNSIDTTVTVSGGGGTTYDLLGSNTTSNNAILTLRDANNNDDNIEIAGSGGTTVSWDGANNRITLGSTEPVNADWNATSGLAQILNKPTIPPAYTLPIAAAGTLGGIKVGANLSIDVDGVLSANTGSYTLPIASSTTLGGIKVGSGLSIDGNGVLTATGGSSVPQIQDLTGTTGSVANNNTTELNITGYKAYALFKITVDTEAWVRVYVDDASRDADLTRSEGQDPTPGSGVIAEVRTSGAESILTSPGIMGFNNDNPRTDNIYLSVTNRSGNPTPITVTLTALQIGE